MTTNHPHALQFDGSRWISLARGEIWRTIHGAKVRLDENGKIVDGPAHLIKHLQGKDYHETKKKVEHNVGVMTGLMDQKNQSLAARRDQKIEDFQDAVQNRFHQKHPAYRWTDEETVGSLHEIIHDEAQKSGSKFLKAISDADGFDARRALRDMYEDTNGGRFNVQRHADLHLRRKSDRTLADHAHGAIWDEFKDSHPVEALTLMGKYKKHVNRLETENRHKSLPLSRRHDAAQDATTIMSTITRPRYLDGRWILARDEGEGVWRTIHGTHVLIKGGKVVEGPAALKGKGHKEAVQTPRYKHADRGGDSRPHHVIDTHTGETVEKHNSEEAAKDSVKANNDHYAVKEYGTHDDVLKPAKNAAAKPVAKPSPVEHKSAAKEEAKPAPKAAEPEKKPEPKAGKSHEETVHDAIRRLNGGDKNKGVRISELRKELAAKGVKPHEQDAALVNLASDGNAVLYSDGAMHLMKPAEREAEKSSQLTLPSGTARHIVYLGDDLPAHKRSVKLSRYDIALGRWITIHPHDDPENYRRLYIEDNGDITKGPKFAVGKNIGHLHDSHHAAETPDQRDTTHVEEHSPRGDGGKFATKPTHRYDAAQGKWVPHGQPDVKPDRPYIPPLKARTPMGEVHPDAPMGHIDPGTPFMPNPDPQEHVGGRAPRLHEVKAAAVEAGKDAKVAEKAPHEMAAAEYADSQMRGYGENPPLGVQQFHQMQHRAFVQKAIEDGKTVPAHVSEDYPDLAGKAKEPLPVASSDPQPKPPSRPVPRELKREHSGNSIHLANPIVGPTGAKIHGYEWQHQKRDTPDGKSQTRVSDWSKAETNVHTGRDVVHHFHVETPDGEHQTVSLETAGKLLGLNDEDGAAAKSQLNKVRELGKTKILHASIKDDPKQAGRAAMLAKSIAQQEQEIHKPRQTAESHWAKIQERIKREKLTGVPFSRHVYRDGRWLALARDSGWVTIHGTHVHIDKGGKIDQGPAALKGRHHVEVREAGRYRSTAADESGKSHVKDTHTGEKLTAHGSRDEANAKAKGMNDAASKGDKDANKPTAKPKPAPSRDTFDDVENDAKAMGKKQSAKPAPVEKKPEPRVTPKAEAVAADQVKGAIHDAIAEIAHKHFEGDAQKRKIFGAGLVPIRDVRAKVAEKLGANAASHEVFDQHMIDQWNKGKVRLLTRSQRGEETTEQIAGGIDDSRGHITSTISHVDLEHYLEKNPELDKKLSAKHHSLSRSYRDGRWSLAPAPVTTGVYLSLGRSEPITEWPAALAGRPLVGPNGAPAHEFWKKVLVDSPSFVHPKTGQKFSVSRDDIKAFARQVTAWNKAGREIPTPVDHSWSARDNLGQVIGAKTVEEDGKLYLSLLHRVYGDDAKSIAQRNWASVWIESDYKDEFGKRHGKAITHSSFVTNPVISGLGPFTPAEAA